MMDSISNSDRLTLTGAVVHLINKDFEALAKDFQTLGFVSPPTCARSFLPWKRCWGKPWFRRVLQLQGDRFSELMFDYPFRCQPLRPDHPRGEPGRSGSAIDPQFRIIAVAYPYVACRLLLATPVRCATSSR